jgi:hypothetical protein
MFFFTFPSYIIRFNGQTTISYISDIYSDISEKMGYIRKNRIDPLTCASSDLRRAMRASRIVGKTEAEVAKMVNVKMVKSGPPVLLQLAQVLVRSVSVWSAEELGEVVALLQLLCCGRAPEILQSVVKLCKVVKCKL